jgi:hypothetical protein
MNEHHVGPAVALRFGETSADNVGHFVHRFVVRLSRPSLAEMKINLVGLSDRLPITYSFLDANI